MRNLLLAMLSTARSSLKARRALALENLALRQQLAVLRRQVRRPKLSRADRAFWVVLARAWARVADGRDDHADGYGDWLRSARADLLCRLCANSAAQDRSRRISATKGGTVTDRNP